MKNKNFKPKVLQIDQVRLNFAEVDEDANLRDTIEELKKKA